MTGLPKNERVWVTYFDGEGNARFIVTSKPLRDQYFLYEVSESGVKKLGKSASPEELAETYDVLAVINGSVPGKD